MLTTTPPLHNPSRPTAQLAFQASLFPCKVSMPHSASLFVTVPRFSRLVSVVIGVNRVIQPAHWDLDVED